MPGSPDPGAVERAVEVFSADMWKGAETYEAMAAALKAAGAAVPAEGEVVVVLTEAQRQALLSFVHGVYPLRLDHLVPELEAALSGPTDEEER